MNPKEDQREVSDVTSSVQHKLSIQMKDSFQRDSNHEKKDELQSNPNWKRHKPAWIKDYELSNKHQVFRIF